MKYLVMMILVTMLVGCAGHKLEYYDVSLGVDKGREWEADKNRTNVNAKVNFHIGVKK